MLSKLRHESFALSSPNQMTSDLASFSCLCSEMAELAAMAAAQKELWALDG